MPTSFIPDLEQMLASFEVDDKGEMTKRLKRDDKRSTIMTKEGPKAVQEAIEFLKNQPRITDRLNWSNRMCECSKQHTSDIGQKGVISHTSGVNNLGTKDRLREHGSIVGCYGENISVFCKIPREVIV